MVKTRKNHIGEKKNHLTIVKQVEDYVDPKGIHRAKFACQCDCGNPNLVEVLYTNFQKGTTTSCGCHHQKVITQKGRGIKKNNYDLTGEYGIGYANNTGNPFFFDLEDFEKVEKGSWYENKRGYIRTNTYNGEKCLIALHQIIFGRFADHKNRNKKDNRKNNLRKADEKENARNRSLGPNNTSGYIGVKWSNVANGWVASIGINDTRINLGTFKDKEDAIIARLKGELKYYGPDFAPQRHLFEQYGITQEDKPE